MRCWCTVPARVLVSDRKSVSRLLALAAIAAAAPATVATTGAQATTWNLPALDVSITSQDEVFPQVAVAPDGATTVVWRSYESGDAVVRAATRPAGSSTFAAPQALSSTGGSGLRPQVAVAPDGATTVVWNRYNGTNTIVQAATRPAGSDSFGAPQDLSSTGQNAAEPQVAVAPDGATIVTWRRSNGANLIIQAATRSAGSSTFAAPQDLSSTGGNSVEPQVAVAPDGATTVTWRRNNGTNTIVQAATRPAGSNTFAAPQDLSNTGQNSYYPQLAVAPDGATTVVWTRYNGASPNNLIIQAATRPAGSNTFAAPQDLSSTGQNADRPQVVVTADGSTTVTWNRYDGSGNIIQTATRPAGSNTFAAPQDLSSTGGNAVEPQLAVAPDGATTVTWSRFNGTNTIIQAATRPAGSNTFAAPQDLSSTGQDAADTQVAVAPDGAITIVWDSFDSGGNYTIQAVTSSATQYTLTTQLTGNGKGSVSSSPGGISCGSSCSASFILSSRVTLTATPASGSTFGGWGGACSGSSATCTLTILGDRAVTANFDPAPEPPTPSNSFTVASTGVRGSSVVTRIRIPGAGRMSQRGTYRAAATSSSATRTACTAARTAAGAGTYTLTCRLNSTARKQRRKGKLRVRIRTTYTPTGGTARSTYRTVTFGSLKPHYTG